MNLFDYQVPATGETLTTLLTYKNITIRRIISSDILEEKTYIQEEDEWVIVLEGEASLSVEGEKKILKKGAMLFIPAKTPHQILQTKAHTLWLAIHIF